MWTHFFVCNFLQPSELLRTDHIWTCHRNVLQGLIAFLFELKWLINPSFIKMVKEILPSPNSLFPLQTTL